MDSTKIGLFIRKLREEKGWNQETLANYLFCDRSRISKIENGNKLPSIEDFLKLGELFDISFEEMIFGERKNKKNEMTIQNNFKDYILKSAANLKKRNLVIAFLLFVIVIIFLGITVLYFFQNYSSIRIYKFYGKSENYEINDGLLILSKEKIYFDVKGIVPEIDTIEIISEINNEKKSVYKGDCKNVLNDLYGYSSIISYKKFINDEQKLYIRINDEEIELNFIEDFKNDNLFYIEKETIGESEKVNHEVPEKILKFFQCDNNKCFLQNKTEVLSFVDNIFILKKDDSEFFFDIINNVFEYHRFATSHGNEILFSYSNNEIICEIGDCKNYNEIFSNFKKNYLEKYIF